MNLSDKDVIEILKKNGAIKKGHFELTSGAHADTYLQCALVMREPSVIFELSKEVISRADSKIINQVDRVASPAIGGIIFGFTVASVLNKPFIFSERKDKVMQFRRAFSVEKHKNYLLVEDVITTGTSVLELAELIEQEGANVLAVISLINRNTKHTFSKYPYFPLINMDVPFWNKSDCKLCARGVEIDTPGSRKS
jgi:orotate phosphoribosyltransferase